MKLFEAYFVFEDPSILLEVKQQAKLSCAYEANVLKAIKVAGIQGKIKKPACFDSNKTDADFNLNGSVYPLEIKYDFHAFLYAGGLRYDRDTGNFSPSNKGKDEVDQEKNEMFQFVIQNFSEVDSLKPKFNKIIDYIESHMPKASNARKKITKGFPVQVTDPIWNKIMASGEGVISVKPVFEDISSFAHYFTTSKGIDYIQIGGHGLFYLENNPANLPIPKLEGKMKLEFKWKTGGLKKDRKIPTRTAGIEIIGRFHDINHSPYTMDEPSSINEMLSKMGIKR